MILLMFNTFRELLYLHWSSEQVTVSGYSQSIILNVDSTVTQCFVSKGCKVHTHNKQMS